LFPDIFLFSGCVHYKFASGNYIPITVNVKNFMHNCFSGTQANGTSNAHVSYQITIEVDEYQSGMYVQANVNTYAS